MRLHLLSLGAIALLGMPPEACADTVYNFALISTQGYAGGSGSFALNVPPPSIGTVSYSFAGGLPYTVGYQIDSFQKSYTPPPGGGPVTDREYPESLSFILFTDGIPSDLSAFLYAGGPASCQAVLNIGESSYSYNEGCLVPGRAPVYYMDAGTVTITPAAMGATPEPSGAVLLGTAMLGIVGIVRRRIASA